MMLVSSFTVTVTPDQGSYTRNQWVTLTATVRVNGTPGANASVTFTITKSNGAVVTGTATTGTNGSAVFKYKLKQQDPVGTYQVKVVATLSGITGSNTTTFTVQ